MFLLVSFRHVGARPGGHQLGVSIQIPINLGKTFLLISRIRNNSLTRILASVFVYLTPFLSQILALNYWTVYIFIFDLCWMAWQWKPAESYRSLNSTRDGSRFFFRRGCTRLLLYFNTNKPHSFFWQNTSCIRKPQVISGWGGGGGRTPCTLPLDPPLSTQLQQMLSRLWPSVCTASMFF